MRIKKPGVYQIVNETNGKFYVGSSTDIVNRWGHWRAAFKKPATYRSRLHAAVQKYGIENFTFIVLEECDPKQCVEREQHYLDTLEPAYNIEKKARLQPENVRAKISKAQTIINTKAKFVKKARQVHGDRYDYSEFDFVSTTTKGSIICSDHGAFNQTPRSHMYGYGCMRCGFVATGSGLRSSLDDFVAKAKETHGDRYDYSQFQYVNSKTKGTIICEDHGAFEQSPEVHVNMRCDCPLCGFDKKGKSKSSNAAKLFIDKAKIIHGNRYDYSKSEYVNASNEITIICKDHGEFRQRPSKHLCGQGCRKCRDERCSDIRKMEYNYAQVCS